MADYSTISQSSVGARKAGARDVGDYMAHSSLWSGYVSGFGSYGRRE
jgi:hypothetical protein